jgi:CheY-like chemotaxis protein
MRRIAMMRILLVEDEVHKQEELTACLTEFYGEDLKLEHVDSVHAAYWSVSVNEFDLVILDMALPTFSAESSASERGHDQALGGVEVLRALKNQENKLKIIIITQYPEITIGGKRVKLSKAAGLLSERYGQEVIGGILYQYRSPSNQTKLTNLLKKMQ